MNEFQRYILTGVALFVPLMGLFWLDIWRARADAAFHAAFPARGRFSPLFFTLTVAEALLGAIFPPNLSLLSRVIVALAIVALSAAVGTILYGCIRALDRLSRE